MNAVLDDARISKGMRAQMELRKRRFNEGAHQVGWKVGFGAPAAQTNLKLTAPLVGFILDRAMLQPGASHERHLHRNCDEFFIVLKGQGHIITDKGLEPSGEGDVVYSPRGVWHGFNNTSTEDVVLVWGWMGAGSIEASGYENPPEGHRK